MAHALDMTNGRANMAYVGATPWHGLGTLIDASLPVDQWTVHAGLGWSVDMVPAQYQFQGQTLTAPDQFLAVRSDTGVALAAASGKYKPHQPAEVMAFFRDFILTDTRFTMETAGSLKGGRVIWALARFQEPVSVNGDDHVAYVLLTTSFDGSLATTAQATMIRVVCNNTLTASLYDMKAQVRLSHVVSFDGKAQAWAHDKLGEVAQGFKTYEALGRALLQTRVSSVDMEAFFTGLVLKGEAKQAGLAAAKAIAGGADPEKAAKEAKLSSRAVNSLGRLLDSYKATLDEGTDRNTGWAALNAVTRFVDHDRNTRNSFADMGGSSEAARQSSAWFGSGAALKAEALKTLATMGKWELAKLGVDVSLSEPLAPADAIAAAQWDVAAAHNDADGSSLLKGLIAAR